MNRGMVAQLVKRKAKNPLVDKLKKYTVLLKAFENYL